MPEYEVVERHRIRVAAPADVVFAAARELDIRQSAVVRTVFRTRELAMRSETGEGQPGLSLVEQAKAWGWGVVAEIPGRELVFGGVTQPWVPNPKFRALSPEAFASFHEPGFVKIAWTLRADPVDASHSLARTETRVATTDPFSRAKFRKYWAFVFPGSVVIRRAALRMVKAEAERRVRETGAPLPRSA